VVWAGDIRFLGVDRLVAVDAAIGAGQGLAGAAPVELDELGGNRDRGLLRGAGAEVEADRRAEPGQLFLGQPDAAQPV
jgi:hypothetical protein